MFSLLRKLKFRHDTPGARRGRRAARTRATQHRLAFEALEARTLLASTAELVNGELTVTGDEANDRITLYAARGGSQILVRGNNVRGGPGLLERFPAGAVTKIYVDAGGGNDRVQASLHRGGLDVEIRGGTGNDRLFARTSDHRNSYILDGGDGNDKLWGSQGPNTLRGGDGDDKIYGGKRSDTMDGGPGNDTMIGGKGNDTMNGGPGNDKMKGGDGDDTMDGGADNDRMDGSRGADTMNGGDGMDTMSGGPGNDTMNGGEGNDTMYGFTGRDTMDGGPGNDTMKGGPGNDTMDGGADNDRMDGGGDSDTMNGGAGCDIVEGGIGDDRVSGGTENDLLLAGPGTDVVVGDPGVDIGYGDARDALDVEIANPQKRYTDPLCFRIEVAGGLSLPEGDEGTTQTVLVTVTRSGEARDAVSVRLETSDGTATGEDYRRFSQTLKYARGELAKTYEIEIFGDNEDEPDETFVLGVYSGEHKVAEQEVTILDDDVSAGDNDPPVAEDDSYGSLGNVGIQVPATDGVLGNDHDPNGDAVAVVPFSGPTNGGGSVQLTADGSLTYTPAPGFQGIDTFTYTLIDPDGAEGIGTVTVNVDGTIWFVDNSSSGGNLGTLIDPFTSLVALNSSPLPEPKEVIFVHETGENYSGGIRLQDSQFLIGEGLTFTFTSLEELLEEWYRRPLPLFSRPLPAINGKAPVIENSSGNGIDLGRDNTIWGVGVGDTSGVGISGFDFSTLTLRDFNITGSGAIAIFENGMVDGVCEDLESTVGADTGIRLFNVGGSIEQKPGASTTILGAQTGVDISGSSGTFRFNSVNIDTPEGDGIILNGNTPDSSFTFDGLNISTGAGRGLVVENVGTITVTGPDNTISAGGGEAVRIVNSTIGPDGITLRRVDANGGPSGIVLDGAGDTGFFTVTGDGTGEPNGSGGTIQGITGPAMFFRETKDVTVRSMEVFGPGGGGIVAEDLAGTNFFVGNGIFDPFGPAIDLSLGKDTEVYVDGNVILGFVPNERSTIGIRTVDPATGQPVTVWIFLRNNRVEAVSLAEPLVKLFVAPGTEMKAQVTGNRFIQYGPMPVFERVTVDGARSCLDLNAGGDPAARNFANRPVVLVREGTAESHVANIDAPSDGPTTAAAVAADNHILGGVVADDGGGLFLPADCFGPGGTGLGSVALSPESYAAALDQILADFSSEEDDEPDPDSPAIDLLLSGSGWDVENGSEVVFGGEKASATVSDRKKGIRPIISSAVLEDNWIYPLRGPSFVSLTSRGPGRRR